MKTRNIRKTVRYAELEIEKINKKIKVGKYKDFSQFARDKTLN